MDSTYNLTSQLHEFNTFSIPNTIKSNMQDCLAKYMKNRCSCLEFDVSGGGRLIEREACLKFQLSGEGLIRKGILIELLQYFGTPRIEQNYFTYMLANRHSVNTRS